MLAYHTTIHNRRFPDSRVGYSSKPRDVRRRTRAVKRLRNYHKVPV